MTAASERRLVSRVFKQRTYRRMLSTAEYTGQRPWRCAVRRWHCVWV